MKYNIIDDEFISRLETLALHIPNPMKGFFGGTHRTKTYGQTVEFADFRDYNLGDDIRRIDWNLYSRFEKHFIRLYVDERQMHIQVFLDCSASMRSADKQKELRALQIMAMIGYLSVQSLDKTTLRLIKGGFADDPGGTLVGKNNFFMGLDMVSNAVEFEGDADIETAILNCQNLGSNDGITVIISDFMTESNWKNAVDYLLFKKRQVMLVQVLSPVEIDPMQKGRVQMIDSESLDLIDGRNMKLRITKAHKIAYRKAMAVFVEDIKSYCEDRGVIFVQARSDQPVENFIEKLMELDSVR